MYDAQIGRFPSVDPIADDFAFVSPFNYAENNVPMSIDLWGLQAVTVHGTNSDNETYTDNKETLPKLKEMSGNETINNDFNWPEGTNGLDNTEADRKVAAEEFAKHVVRVHKENPEETITLIGHSHGGNVAIQAIDLIRAEVGKDVKINLITISTPAYNGEGDKENPASTSVDKHVHNYSGNDIIQVNGSSSMPGSKQASRRYDFEKTTNVQIRDWRPNYMRKGQKVYKRNQVNSHSPHYYHPNLLRGFKK